MHLAYTSPAHGHASQVGRTDPSGAGSRLRLLECTLSITSAQTEPDLVQATVTAAREVTGAQVAAAYAADGLRCAAGDDRLTARLLEIDGQARTAHLDDPAAALAGVLAGALAGAGLGGAITLAWAELVIVVACIPPGSLAPDSDALLTLIVGHADAARDRLLERERLSLRADSDPLTGLRHHRPFSERLGAASPGRTAVIALDVDGFKKINDEYGHQAGDRALVVLVDALRAALRGDDQLYRIGGDEFAVVIDVSGLAEAEAVVVRLLDAARRSGHTVSAGTAIHLLGETGRETLLRADKALYEAKRAGRNTSRLAA